MRGSAVDLPLGTRIIAIGYPKVFGETITYTSGDFSGRLDQFFLKISAVVEHGSSGGGSYLSDGTYIGMPTGGLEGSANTMGLILSIDAIKSWLTGKPMRLQSANNNNYDRLSAVLLQKSTSAIAKLPEVAQSGNQGLLDYGKPTPTPTPAGAAATDKNQSKTPAPSSRTTLTSSSTPTPESVMPPTAPPEELLSTISPSAMPETSIVPPPAQNIRQRIVGAILRFFRHLRFW